MKCWCTTFNAQGLRLVIVVIYTVRSNENICSGSSGGAQEKGKTGWHSVYYQNWWFSQFHPSLNANVLFCRFFLNLTLCMTKLRVLVLCFFYITDNFSTLSALAQITLLLEMMKLSPKKKILFSKNNFVWRNSKNNF